MTVFDPATADAIWPQLPPFADWEATHTTLHMWTQIVGKVRLGLSPPINHSWGVALYVTSRGLTTSLIPTPQGGFAIDFDFVSHALRVTTTQGAEIAFALEPMTVAAFYEKIRSALRALDIAVAIYGRPVEVVESIPFSQDTQHAGYDADAVHRFWTVLVRGANVLAEFRAGFIGKCSPVHLFWGANDLAVTRFSGRTAPKHPGGSPNCPARVMEEAYSHEVSSAGFWAGAGLGEAAFYSYAYPTPAGFGDWPVRPEAARFHADLGEFILPYEAIRASNPRLALLAFLQSTYEGAATLADWNRAALERQTAGA